MAMASEDSIGDKAPQEQASGAPGDAAATPPPPSLVTEAASPPPSPPDPIPPPMVLSSPPPYAPEPLPYAPEPLPTPLPPPPPFVNKAPVVDAGPDQAVQWPSEAALNGLVIDDTLPGPALVIEWTKLSGPGDVTFAEIASPITTATFSECGVYVLRLMADDSQLRSTADVTIYVHSHIPAPEE
jgi:hypothetical protein